VVNAEGGNQVPCNLSLASETLYGMTDSRGEQRARSLTRTEPFEVI